jgi:hypothetical protein
MEQATDCKRSAQRIWMGSEPQTGGSMHVTCQGCQARFELPEEKMPKDREVWLVCPTCRIPFQWKAPSKSPSNRQPATSEASNDLLPIDIVAEGVETALLCATNFQHVQVVEQALKNLGYFVSLAQSAKSALIKLRNNDYDLFLLDETFEGGKQEKEILLQFIQQMPIHARRQCFFCIFSEESRTLDNMAAFCSCANLIINLEDLDKTEVVLQKSVAEHKNFYKVLMQESKEAQKS